MDEDRGLIYDILRRILDGWDSMLVRVRQDGKREWMTLGKVKDQRTVLKVVKDLMKQAARENGV